MVRYLVDTNVISELRKRERCNRHVARWFEQCPTEDIFISAVTVGEIRKGVELIRLRDSASAAALDGWLHRLLSDHRDRIVPVDETIAEEWGRLNAPDPLPVIDSLLAATAKVRGMTFVTRNVRDIETTGVDWFNPFDDSTTAGAP
jgi:predicted nucleic acid-binding protein